METISKALAKFTPLALTVRTVALLSVCTCFFFSYQSRAESFAENFKDYVNAAEKGDRQSALPHAMRVHEQAQQTSP